MPENTVSTGVSVAARDRFFDQCSQLLKSSSPTVAGAVRHEQVLLRGLARGQTAKELTKHQYCPACGGIEMEERTILVNQSNKVPLEDGNQDPVEHRLLLQKCMRCARTMKLFMDERAVRPPPTNPEKAHNSYSTSADTPLPDASNSGIKVSSKKRAKARKDREGLKALLQKEQTSSKSSNMLSLMDFMAGPG